MSTQGTGAITFTPLVFTNPYGGFLGLDADANRLWIGSTGTAAAAPAILIGHDFPYLTQKTKAVPPYITALGGTLRDYATTGHLIYDYYPGTYTYPWDMNITGDGPGDERIAYIEHTGAYALFNPADAAAARMSRVIGAGMARSHDFNIDETRGQPMVYNNGPAKNGITYAAMGAVQPNVRTWPYLGGSLMSPYANTYDYDAFYDRYGQRMDGSHLPVPFQVPMLKSGNPEWQFLMMQEANAVLAAGYNGSQTISGTTYYRPLGINQQTRGTSWGLRAVAQANYFARSNDPTAPYIKDLLKDQADWLVSVHANYLDVRARTLGFFVNDVTGTNPAFQPWQNDFLYGVTGIEAWRGEYSGFSMFAAYHGKFAVGRMDTVGGGCLWAGASRYAYPFTTDVGEDYANISQTLNVLFSHMVNLNSTTLAGSGWDPAQGGPVTWSCPSSGLITDPGGSFINQPSSLIAFQATTPAIASILGVSRAQSMYTSIRALEYAAGMSFTSYNDSHGRIFSVPEFAWGYLGATQ